MIENTVKNLQNNNMEAYFAPKKEDILPLVKSLLKKGDVISCGGSMTLLESGVFALMQSGDYNFLDRSQKGLTKEDINDIYKNTFGCDVFLCSANALTENGEIYCVDGFANRIAAMLYGPKSVICIVGVNKIVPDIAAAVKRVKTVAAPKNAKRLNMQTPCAKTGICCMPEGDMGTGCRCDARICASSITIAHQMVKNRIKVIICGEELGY